MRKNHKQKQMKIPELKTSMTKIQMRKRHSMVDLIGQSCKLLNSKKQPHHANKENKYTT